MRLWVWRFQTRAGYQHFGVISAIITVWLGIMVSVDSVRQRKSTEQNAHERKLHQLQQKTAAAQLCYPPIISLPQHVLLRRGERCHYQGKTTFPVIKHEVVGYRISYSSRLAHYHQPVCDHDGREQFSALSFQPDLHAIFRELRWA